MHWVTIDELEKYESFKTPLIIIFLGCLQLALSVNLVTMFFPSHSFMRPNAWCIFRIFKVIEVQKQEISFFCVRGHEMIRKNTTKRNMSSALCASSMYSRLCMKMSSFLFVRLWTMPRILYSSCGILCPV